MIAGQPSKVHVRIWIGTMRLPWTALDWLPTPTESTIISTQYCSSMESQQKQMVTQQVLLPPWQCLHTWETQTALKQILF